MSARSIAAAAGVSVLLLASPAAAGCFSCGCAYAAPVYVSPCGYSHAHPHYVVQPYYIVNQGPTYSGPYPHLWNQNFYPYEYYGHGYRRAYAPRWVGYNARLHRPYRPRHAYYGRARMYPRHMHAPYAKTPLPPVPRPRIERKRGPVVQP